MSPAIPVTIAKDLLGRIEHLFGSDDEPSEFVKRQLLREAEALTRVDPAVASMVKAAIAAFSWDLPQAQRWVNNAMQLSSSINTRINAALTYKFLNRVDLASDISVATLKLAPLDVEVVNRTLSYLIWSGQFDRAVPIYRDALANKVKLAEEVVDPEFYLQAMQRVGVSQQRLVFELAAACDVLTQNGKRVRFLTTAVEVDPESGDESLLFGLGFWGSLDDEMRLESQLAHVFADAPGWNPSALSVELQYEQPQHADQFA
jgi:hypothetical protein